MKTLRASLYSFLAMVALGAVAQTQVWMFDSLDALLATDPRGISIGGKSLAVVLGRHAPGDWPFDRNFAYDRADASVTNLDSVFTPAGGVGRWRALDTNQAIFAPVDQVVFVATNGVSTGGNYTTAERVLVGLGADDSASAWWDVDRRAPMVWKGDDWGPGISLGAPSAGPELAHSRLGLVAGTVRQSGWYQDRHYFISDGNHHPIGVSGDYALAGGGSAAFTLERSFAKFVTMIGGPDESYASVPGVRVGFSSTTNVASFSATAPYHGDFTVRWNGSSWVVTPGLGADLSVVVDSYAFGQLQLSHSYCRAIATTVTPWTVGGTVPDPYIPVLGVIQNAYLVIQWVDPAFGTVVSSGPSTRMAASVRKLAPMGLYLDGQFGSTNLVGTIAPVVANTWFFGLYQE